MNSAAGRKKKKLAAALAAVERYLAEEAAALAAARGPAAPALSGPSPWALAARIAAVSARMGSLGTLRPR